MDSETRDKIIAEPEVLLDDKELMRALVAANERAMGHNIVDLRGIAMERLEIRLDRLEDTHRSVIAAAYENLAGTNQIHRAVLCLLDSTRFEGFLHNLSSEVADNLRVDAMRLVLETRAEEGDPAVRRLQSILSLGEPGFVDSYITRGRPVAPRTITLRQLQAGDPGLYGDGAADMRSEACLRLDLGDGRLPGLLALGSEDPHRFAPQQGTDLLAFFGAVLERVLRRWLDG